MSSLIKRAAALCCVLALSACGGGGGSDSGNGGNAGNVGSGGGTNPGTGAGTGTGTGTKPDQSWLKLTPASVDLTVLEGEPVEFSIMADSNKLIPQVFNVGVVEKNGVIEPKISLGSWSPVSYEAKMTTSAALAVGTHASTIELRLCEDDPLVCRTPIAGSPWLIPVKITVKPANVTTPLRHITALANWSTSRGNPAHNAYVPAAFDPPNFSRRWVLDGVGNESVTHDNGMVFLAQLGMRMSGAVRSISEDTGKEVWRQDRLYAQLDPVAASNGRLYVIDGFSSAWLNVLDQTSGDTVGFELTGSPDQRDEAPVVHGNGLYVAGHDSSPLAKYDAASGRLVWRANGIPYATRTPAASGDHVYVYMQKKLYKVGAGDGTIASVIDNGPMGHADDREQHVVLSPAGRMAFVAENGTLYAFDLAKNALAWRTDSTVIGQPAVAGDMLYVFGSSGTLEARDVATGTVQWTASVPLAGFASSLLVTNNLVFVSTGGSTQAIDLTTHRKVWEYPLAGELSLSNRGILYIAGGGKLVAFNLH